MKHTLWIVLFLPFFLMGCGDGALKRTMTISGIYSVREPDGYPVVCFIEANGGGIDCVPLEQLGLTPKKK